MSRTLVLSLAADTVLVLVFAIIGRASHDEDLSIAGIAVTAWPFLVGLVLGWILTRVRRAPLAPVRTGVGVWAATVVVGMLLRLASGQGVQVAFVIVAAIVLALFLVGWRALTALVERIRRRART